MTLAVRRTAFPSRVTVGVPLAVAAGLVFAHRGRHREPVRVLTLVGLVNWLGVDTGYYWGHTLLGSMVSVFGGAAALVAFVWLATRK